MQNVPAKCPSCKEKAKTKIRLVYLSTNQGNRFDIWAFVWLTKKYWHAPRYMLIWRCIFRMINAPAKCINLSQVKQTAEQLKAGSF